MADESVVLLRDISKTIREHLDRKSRYNDLSGSADKALKSLLTRIGVWELSRWGQCCCDNERVVQPCGPCRCDDHDKCADLT
ncbi:hypothetical protein KIV64_gp26 [Mycobacterium phage DroogsArmy]|uniref:Uncharacterized protein n=1 Tax=Mycobacterium phage DroogsArmy TaxID=2744011 RepID=A0A6N0A4P3_9CAUD|nr:hypothetical protein KIV64_gp26 [Mycobacterium phage DroogsArmy]QKO02462.1 hypothetical protein SEA_DROOGSARMY_66 [Mycobacterium phage DroogsArmy]